MRDSRSKLSRKNSAKDSRSQPLLHKWQEEKKEEESAKRSKRKARFKPGVAFFFCSVVARMFAPSVGTMIDGEHAITTSGGTAWRRRQRLLRAFRRYVLWHSKMEIAAAIHHTSRLRTSTTQTVNFASVPAAATYAATASVPVVEHVTPDPAVYTASAPANEYTVSAPGNEYVASARVIEYVTPAPVTTFLEPPVPAVYTVQVCELPNVQNTFETPQSQTVGKIVEHPEIRTFQGTRASKSLGTAPGRHVAFSEIVEWWILSPLSLLNLRFLYP